MMGETSMNSAFRSLSIGVIVALGSFMDANGSASAQADPGDMKITQSPGRVLTTLKLAQGDPIPVVFDTGTSGNIIDQKLAARLGLPKLGPSTAIDGSLGKPVPGFLTELKGAALGGIAIDDDKANAIDYDLPGEKGIFGPDSFKGRIVVMDLGRNSIRVKSKADYEVPHEAGIPYIGQGDDALPSVIVEVGDTKIPAELDTGNNEAFIFPLSLAKTFPLEGELKRVGFATSAAGRQPMFRARLKSSLKVGPVVVERPDVLFIDGGQPNVGLPVARKLVVVLDPAERLSWLISPAR
jgi:hypothetical protein